MISLQDIPLSEALETPVDPLSIRRTAEARRVVERHFPFKCCAVCGMQMKTALTIAHLDHRAGNNSPHNLAVLCQTHHRMYDGNLYPSDAIRHMQMHWQMTGGIANFSACTKDSGKKAAATRKANSAAKKSRFIAWSPNAKEGP